MGHAHVQAALGGEGGSENMGAWSSFDRDRLTSDGRLVHEGVPGYYLTIHRHLLAWTYDHDFTRCNLING